MDKIVYATESGGMVYLYNEKNHVLTRVHGKLVSFTPDYVITRISARFNRLYNANGKWVRDIAV